MSNQQKTKKSILDKVALIICTLALAQVAFDVSVAATSYSSPQMYVAGRWLLSGMVLVLGVQQIFSFFLGGELIHSEDKQKPSAHQI